MPSDFSALRAPKIPWLIYILRNEDIFMISLHILDVKGFMSQLLLRDTFDRFYLTEASITTFGTFYIDGHLQKQYYSQEELENEEFCHNFTYWKQVRPFCLELIKGKKTPLHFKIVFQLSSSNTEKLLKQAGVSLSLSDVGGLYLNLHYDGHKLNCVTGTSLNIFTMDKSLERSWDEMVGKFFRAKEIPVEE